MAAVATNIPSSKCVLGTAFVSGSPASFSPTRDFVAKSLTVQVARRQPLVVTASAAGNHASPVGDLSRRQLFTLAATSAAAPALADVFGLTLPAVAAPFPGPELAVLNPGKYGSPAEQEALRALIHKTLDPVIDIRPTRGGNAGAILRLAFHDAFTRDSTGGGANASIQFEGGRRPNTSLPPAIFRALNGVARTVNAKRTVPVSLADIYMLAGAQAVEKTGGPKIPVPLGRSDATSADPDDLLPSRRAAVGELRQNFLRAEVNFTDKDLVALSGAHTIGLSRGIRPGTPLDRTPASFDNTYFKQLLLRQGVFTSDNALAKDGPNPGDDATDTTLPYVKLFAEDQKAFFDAFTDAYIKMSLIGWTLPA